MCMGELELMTIGIKCFSSIISTTTCTHSLLVFSIITYLKIFGKDICNTLNLFFFLLFRSLSP